MPGPVSDSYDPEFGTGENCEAIRAELRGMYEQVSIILRHQHPIFILDLIKMQGRLNQVHQAALSEYEWRLLRFALERAIESI